MSVLAGTLDATAAGPMPARYVPSGRADWPVLLPLSVAAMAVAVGMGFLLHLADLGAYLLVATPALLGIPVFAALVAAVYLGKCRSVGWAWALGATLALTYYLSYWALSYHFRVVAAGPRFMAAVADAGGGPGVVGYFVFRCRIALNGVALDSLRWQLLVVAGRGLELGVLLAMGLYGARRLAGRVFFEEHGRWASSNAFMFTPAELPDVLAAVESGDWERLDRIEKRTPTREQRRQGGMIFRVEFLPRAADLPVYATVEGPCLRRARRLLMMAPALGRLVRRDVDQRRVPPGAARQLARHVGMIDLGDAPPADRAGGAVPYWSGDSRAAASPHGGLIRSMFREVGLTGVTYVGEGGGDFRDAASAASLAALAAAREAGEDGVAASLCYRVTDNALPALRRTSRVETGICWTLVGVALAGVPIAAFAPAAWEWHSRYLPGLETMMLIWMAFTAAALALVVSSGLIHRRLLGRRFRTRPDCVLAKELRPFVVRVEDPATYHVCKQTPEDWGLCVLDCSNRRLLVEGVSHRYVVHARDVTALVPLVSGASQSVRVDCCVAAGVGDGGGEAFSFVLHRYANGATILYGFAILPLLNLVLLPYVRRGSARFRAKIAGALALPD